VTCRKIVGKAEEGALQRKIASDLGVAKSTVGDAVKHALERLHRHFKPRLGRPTK
jgi:transposase